MTPIVPWCHDTGKSPESEPREDDMSQPFDDRHDDGWRPFEPDTGQTPGTPDTQGGSSDGDAADQRH